MNKETNTLETNRPKNGGLELNGAYQAFTAMGTVLDIFATDGEFTIKLLSEDIMSVRVSRTTWYEVLRNIGDHAQDRVPEPEPPKLTTLGAAPDRQTSEWEKWNAKRTMLKYIEKGRLVCVQGVLSLHAGKSTFEARRVVLMHSQPESFSWEKNHWWLHQINALFEQWLDVLFQDKREITENDFAQHYRTNLDLLGGATSDITQECATLSRFLYGLSSSFLLTGNPRALSAARACAAYLINGYADVRRGGRFCLWKFGRVRDGRSTRQIFASLNSDDRGTYALYEQIYALSGLAQYYRITQDVWVLSYITRTIEAFQALFLDEKSAERPENDLCFAGKGGYFSHIDYVTLRPDSSALDETDNRCRKNWNSVGDHIPAYLVNLLLAIDPIPESDHEDSWVKLRTLCRKILDDCVNNIIRHFCKREDGSRYVQERFHADWKPDRTWRWQQNRAIVGHDLKIAWNLTRCGHYYTTLSTQAAREGNAAEVERYNDLAQRCYETARALGHDMIQHGVDLVRGGVFDAVERSPSNGMPIEFAWETTKDFWQQEQGILAYYILHGIERPKPNATEGTGGYQAGSSPIGFLHVARCCAAFWNIFFIDQDYRKVYLRTTESGMPVIHGQYGVQGGHAIAGYHAFELSYLAHIYIRSYVSDCAEDDDHFSLTFCPLRNSSLRSLNVLPDFCRPGDLEISQVRINGHTIDQPVDGFQIDLSDVEPNSMIEVTFRRRVEEAIAAASPKPELAMLVSATRSVRPRIEFRQFAPTSRQMTETPSYQSKRPM